MHRQGEWREKEMTRWREREGGVEARCKGKLEKGEGRGRMEGGGGAKRKQQRKS